MGTVSNYSCAILQTVCVLKPAQILTVVARPNKNTTWLTGDKELRPASFLFGKHAPTPAERLTSVAPEVEAW